MKKQFVFERECIHRERGVEGDSYNGIFFVQALQRLQSADAMNMARKVTPFFWVDAPRVLVWLCRECAAELHISDAPRAVLQSARR
jgi:hypothetical protein